jgi:hypothetical protein
VGTPSKINKSKKTPKEKEIECCPRQSSIYMILLRINLSACIKKVPLH